MMLAIRREETITMLRKAFLVTTLVLFTYDISHALSDVDVQVCEAQPTDDLRIECYRDLMLNPSCHVLKKTSQLPCFRRSALKTVLVRKDKAPPSENKSKNPGDDFFGQPQRLCSALSNIGLGTSGWSADTSSPENQWRCQSDPVSFGSSGEHSKNEISYEIYGTTLDRASQIHLTVDINNPAEQDRALKKLEATTKALFKAIPEHLPLELVLALRHKKPVSIFTEYGTVNLIQKAGENESYTITLTDTEIASDQVRLRARATNDFESCRMATAKAVGYSVSRLSGTGVPLQGLGFKSYRLSGGGVDWFICQVYPGGKYKIEAAMGGRNISEYVAEGSFSHLRSMRPSGGSTPEPARYR